MMIIGVDYHPSFQAIAFFVEETAECGEQELNHGKRKNLPRRCSRATIWPFAPCDSFCLAKLSNSKRGNVYPTAALGGRTVLQ
jgi:hypothetical protein